ncbi:MAG: Flp pilus assembly complex ATPase component TadA [Myxococcales bacterium]|nr:Flp pilus assembly complex ATPase component TadA [Myxococcales bacterium]
MFTVSIREKGGDLQTRHFDKQEVSIGRIQGNDIVLPKGNISKRHARIVNRDNGFVVVDLRSTNGTYVNGHKITSPMVVTENDKLYVGDYVLQVHLELPETVEAPPPASNNADLDSTRALDVGVIAGKVAPQPQAMDETAAALHSLPTPAPARVEPAVAAVATAAPAAQPQTSQPISGANSTWATGQPDPAKAVATGSVKPVAIQPQTPAAAPRTLAPPPEPVTVAIEPPKNDASVGFPTAAVHAAAQDVSAFERYILALELLEDRARDTVFRGKDIDNIDFERQWVELESAVLSLVESAKRSGEIAASLDSATLTTDILYEITALGPVEYYLGDDEVSEVYVNSFNQIFVKRGNTTSMVWKSYSSPRAMENCVDRLAKAAGHTDGNRPAAFRGRLDNATHFQVARKEATLGSPAITFVKPYLLASSMDEMLRLGTITDDMRRLLLTWIQRERYNLLIAGPNHHGRQAVLGALLSAVGESERIAIIDRAAALAISHANVVRIDGYRSDSVQIADSLGTDRLVAAELAADHAESYLRLLATNRDGCFASMFARSPHDLGARLSSIIGSSSSNPTNLLLSAIQGIVFVTTDNHGTPHVTHVGELQKDEDGTLGITERYRREGHP